MENTTSTLPPSYQDIVSGIGAQLKERKSLLMWRVLLVSWPMILLVAGIYLGKELGIDLESIPHPDILYYGVGVAVYAFFALVYGAIMNFVFEIEKRIWIDSYFDGKKLSSKQSWKMAIRLFWPAAMFRIRLIFSYYIIPFFGFTAAIVLAVWICSRIMPEEQIFIAILVGVVLLIVGLVVYGYYMRTRLRYAWFVFLDKFGNAYSYRAVISEMNDLNNIAKSETFKKSLVASIGTDSINSLANMVIGGLSLGIAQLGGVGRVIGAATRVYGQELSRQATDLANIVAQYILYRFARKELYGAEQSVNDALYATAPTQPPAQQ